jgi:hypothetical protein
LGSFQPEFTMDVEAPAAAVNCNRLTALALDAARGLCHVHRGGFVHLDIKVENILVDGTGSVAKLCDFGQAVRGSACGSQTWGGGTRGRVGPEQVVPDADGCFHLSAAADVWAFGVVLWQVWTGFGTFGAMAKVCAEAEQVGKSLRATCSASGPALVALRQELGLALRRLLLTGPHAHRIPSDREQGLVEWCLRIVPTERPTMDAVVLELESMCRGEASPVASTPAASTPAASTPAPSLPALDASQTLARLARTMWDAKELQALDTDVMQLLYFVAGSDGALPQEQCEVLGLAAFDLCLLFELQLHHMLGKRVAEGLFLACVRCLGRTPCQTQCFWIAYGGVCALLAVRTLYGLHAHALEKKGKKKLVMVCFSVKKKHTQRMLVLCGCPDNGFTFGIMAWNVFSKQELRVCTLEVLNIVMVSGVQKKPCLFRTFFFSFFFNGDENRVPNMTGRCLNLWTILRR